MTRSSDLSLLYELIKKAWLLPYKFPFLENYLYPFQYFFNITSLCNLDCWYCHNRQTKLEAKKDLSTQEVLNIIKKTPAYALIVLSGGEPLMRKDFCEIVRGIAALKKQQALVTNGLLLDDKIIQEIIKCKVLNVGVSIDGDRSFYEEVKGKGNYDILISNLERINYYKSNYKSTWPCIDWKTTVFQHNTQLLPELVILADKLQADTITFSLPKQNNYQFNDVLGDLSVLGATAKNSSGGAVLTDSFRKSLVEVYSRLTADSKKYQVRQRFNPYINNVKHIEKIFSVTPVGEKYYNCFEPWLGLHINPQGDVYPCVSINTGNLIDQSLKEILTGNKYKKIRKVFREQGILEICSGCCWAKCR